LRKDFIAVIAVRNCRRPALGNLVARIVDFNIWAARFNAPFPELAAKSRRVVADAAKVGAGVKFISTVRGRKAVRPARL
jgi:hypothetical protein